MSENIAMNQVFRNAEKKEALVYKRLDNPESRISLLGGNSNPTYINGAYGITISPFWARLTNIQHTGQKRLLAAVWSKVCTELDGLVANELHYETFTKGDLHAHGTIELKEDLSSEQRDAIARKVSSYLGKRGVHPKVCCFIKRVEDMDKWRQYINKQNEYGVYVWTGDNPNIKQLIQNIYQPQVMELNDEVVEAVHREYLRREQKRLRGKMRQSNEDVIFGK